MARDFVDDEDSGAALFGGREELLLLEVLSESESESAWRLKIESMLSRGVLGEGGGWNEQDGGVGKARLPRRSAWGSFEAGLLLLLGAEERELDLDLEPNLELNLES